MMQKDIVYDLFGNFIVQARSRGASADDLSSVALGFVVAMAIHNGVTREAFVGLAEHLFDDVSSDAAPAPKRSEEPVVSKWLTRWHSCSDIPPPLHEDVLVAYKTEWQWEMRVARRMEGDWYDGHEFKIAPDVVTHWARIAPPRS